MKWLLPLLVFSAGCGSKAPEPAPSPAPETAKVETPVRPSPRAKPANLSAALALVELPPAPGAEENGSGFALSSPDEGGGERLHATFHSTETPAKLAELYSKEGLELLNKVGDLQLAGKSKNGSDVIMWLRPAKGGGTDLEIRAILYE